MPVCLRHSSARLGTFASLISACPLRRHPLCLSRSASAQPLSSDPSCLSQPVVVPMHLSVCVVHIYRAYCRNLFSSYASEEVITGICYLECSSLRPTVLLSRSGRRLLLAGVLICPYSIARCSHTRRQNIVRGSLFFCAFFHLTMSFTCHLFRSSVLRHVVEARQECGRRTRYAILSITPLKS